MIKQGIIAGLIVMACWGIADFLQSVPIRRIGTLKTMFVRNILTIFLVSPIGAYLFFNNQLSITLTNLSIIFVSSIIYILSYYMFMRGFEVGNVSLVSPISGSFSIITVMLALLFLGESLSIIKFSAVFLMLAGVFLTSTDIMKIRSITSQKGLKEALLAMTGFGLSFFILGFVSKQMNSLNIFIFASLSQAFFFIALSVMKRGLITKGDMNIELASIFIIHSLIVNTGWFAYIFGVGIDLVSLVTPLSSLFPGITVLLALLFYKEKLVTNQKLGIIGILVGVFLISR